MLSRVSFVSALAFAVPIVLVLIGIAVLRRAAPTSTAGTVSSQPATVSAQPVAERLSAAIATPVAIGQATAPAPRPSEPAAPSMAIAPTAAPAPRPSGPAAPNFDGGGAWLNSEPLSLADLGTQGKVVLVDFWTYGCYNCANTLPYIKQWWAKYKDQGLVIVGVHTPEFQSEHVLANVRDAVEREGIGWPVVQDNDYTIWRAYGNNYWPRFYLIDERGQIIYDHIGEGAYDETERQIVAALAAKSR